MEEGQIPQDAALELFARRQARDKLLDFVKYCMPGYQAAKHHHYMAQRLEKIASGQIKRLILLMPPRSGKSEVASRHLPAWYIGRNPRKQVICATYNAEFAHEFGRDVRRIVQSTEYNHLFPDVELAADSKAANRWQTRQGGSYLAAGVGTGITGRGADLVVIDDPVKGKDDADSKLFRDRLWSWYRAVLYTRLMPNASIVLVQTKWHDDDLAGRLLMEADDGGEPWEVISLPAVAREGDALGREVGEALWPSWFPLETLEEIRRTVGPRDWASLYQQEPVEEEGAFFRKEWIQEDPYDKGDLFQEFTTGQRPLHIYGASDYAVTDGGGDYTVHVVCGVDSEDTIYVLDVWREQAASDVWVEQVCDMMSKWKPLMWAEETGQINKSIGPYLVKRMKERRVYCRREQFPSVADKPTRARAIQARMSMGKVRFPKHASWLEPLVYEMTRFPTGLHDDQVDAIGLIGRILDSMFAAHPLPEQENNEVVLTPTTYGDIRKNHKQRRKYGRGRLREAIVVG